jgi:tetratricopeptide (TPR) repeat protein
MVGRTTLFPFVVLVALLTTGAVATAAPDSADKEHKAAHDHALKLFDQSRVQYREGHFQEAVALLLEARQLEAAPVLLYNLARAYEGLGDRAHALEAYTAYLSEQPDAADRGAIEERIHTLQRDIAEHERLERQRQEAVERANQERASQERQQPQPAQPITARIGLGPWLTMGAGGAVLATGVVFAGLAQSAHNGAKDDQVQTSANSKQHDAQRLATWANVSFAVGGTVALVGVVWGILRLRSTTSRTASLTADVVTDGRSVFVNARF